MKLRAHVPTQQYGFMEIEGDPEELERLRDCITTMRKRQ